MGQCSGMLGPGLVTVSAYHVDTSRNHEQEYEFIINGNMCYWAKGHARAASSCSSTSMQQGRVHICNIYNIYYLHIVLCCAAPGRDWRLVE